MKKNKSKIKTGKKRITFTLKNQTASQVSLVGEFNGWDEKKHPMKRVGEGTWTKTVVLLPGQYQYRFMVDGIWAGDPENPETCRNCFGSENNVIRVG